MTFNVSQKNRYITACYQLPLFVFSEVLTCTILVYPKWLMSYKGELLILPGTVMGISSIIVIGVPLLRHLPNIFHCLRIS